MINYNFQELTSYIHSFIRKYDPKSEKIDFFDILFEFSDKMISYHDENYRFKYEYTDIWRKYTKSVDEETAVISAIIQDDMRKCNFNRTACYVVVYENPNKYVITECKIDEDYISFPHPDTQQEIDRDEVKYQWQTLTQRR